MNNSVCMYIHIFYNNMYTITLKLFCMNLKIYTYSIHTNYMYHIYIYINIYIPIIK